MSSTKAAASFPLPSATSPWKKVVSPAPAVDLSDIMSEQLAAELQQIEVNQKEEAVKIKGLPPPDVVRHRPDTATANVIDDQQHPSSSRAAESMTVDEIVDVDGLVDTSSDEALARLLQMQFDREHDKMLSREQNKFNGDSKVSVSFDRYRSRSYGDSVVVAMATGADNGDSLATTTAVAMSPAATTAAVDPIFSDDSSDDTDDDVRERRNAKLDVNKTLNFGRSGVVVQNGTFVSKHDKQVCGRKNASRVMQFPPDFKTGDGASIDMQLSNKVYNLLKTHSIQESKRAARLHEKKEKSTAEHSLDAKTRLVLFKMVNGGLLDSIRGVVGTGKEAVILHAFGGNVEGMEIPCECAVKVFKTTLAEFKNRKEYVTDDYRFRNPRKVMKVWAEKEKLNLNRMRRGGVRCPMVVRLKGHVLVMSFVGDDGRPAPQLKEAMLDENELRLAYQQCVECLELLYRQCRLVHADFSEFNVLWWNQQCHVIDVGQGVDVCHPRALIFLARDCLNITQFFRRQSLPEELVLGVRQLFERITQLDLQPSTSTPATAVDEEEQRFLAEVEQFSVDNRNARLRHDKTHSADCILRKAIDDAAVDIGSSSRVAVVVDDEGGVDSVPDEAELVE